MKYLVESTLEDFDAWSGGLTVLNDIKALPNSQECLDCLEEFIDMEQTTPTDTMINDFLWFGAWDVLIDNGLVESE